MQYLIIRLDGAGRVAPSSRGSAYFPRVSEGTDPEDAVANMFEDELKPAGTRHWLALPLETGTVVTAKPRREFDIQSRPYQDG